MMITWSHLVNWSLKPDQWQVHQTDQEGEPCVQFRNANSIPTQTARQPDTFQKKGIDRTVTYDVITWRHHQRTSVTAATKLAPDILVLTRWRMCGFLVNALFFFIFCLSLKKLVFCRLSLGIKARSCLTSEHRNGQETSIILNIILNLSCADRLFPPTHTFFQNKFLFTSALMA